MPNKTLPSLVFGLLAGFAVLTPMSAHASQEFPGAIQEAAGIPCVPTCTLCHGKTPGDAGSFTVRQLPKDLIAAANNMIPGAHDTAALKAAFAAYAPTHATQVMDLKAGLDPQTGDSLCGPTYGCGASIAPRPAAASGNDGTSPLWFAALAMVLGVVGRRFKRR